MWQILTERHSGKTKKMTNWSVSTFKGKLKFFRSKIVKYKTRAFNRKFEIKLIPVLLKVARNSFYFPQTSCPIIFQIQFGLSYQCEIDHRHKWNVIETFFPENLLPWQRCNAFSCTPKIESNRVIKRTGRWNLLKLIYYMLLGMTIKICNFKKIL